MERPNENTEFRYKRAPLSQRIIERILSLIVPMLFPLLVRIAKRNPYSHLKHSDGSFYMKRYWLFKGKGQEDEADESDGLRIRLHHIVTPDWDAAMHDHPWDFWSIVLNGGYAERRPKNPRRPVFECADLRTDEWSEPFFITVRGPGSIAKRRAHDRHRIWHVQPDTWTLFITGPRLQWWGFYTRFGKIWYQHYESQHQATRYEE